MIVGYHPLKIGENEGTIGRVFGASHSSGKSLCSPKRAVPDIFSNCLKRTVLAKKYSHRLHRLAQKTRRSVAEKLNLFSPPML